MDKGGAFAVRRLNRVVIETLLDPTTRFAALQTWDLLAREQVVGLSHHATQEQISDVAGALQDVAITALATDHAAHLAEVIVDGFFDGFGGYTPTELLDQLDLTREDLVADLVRLAAPVVRRAARVRRPGAAAAGAPRAVLHLGRGRPPAGLTRPGARRERDRRAGEPRRSRRK